MKNCRTICLGQKRETPLRQWPDDSLVVTLGDRRQLVHVLLTRLRYAVQIEEELLVAAWRGHKDMPGFTGADIWVDDLGGYSCEFRRFKFRGDTRFHFSSKRQQKVAIACREFCGRCRR